MAATGPIAVVDLETTGLQTDPDSEILEFGALLLEPSSDVVESIEVLLSPSRPIPRAVQRLTGITSQDAKANGVPFSEVREALAAFLSGRTLIAHNAAFERHFLGRFVARELDEASYLDTLDLLSVTHPDAPDLRLESFTRMLFDTEERHRALDDAKDTLRVISAAAAGALRGEARYAVAAHALESFAAESPWRVLLGKPPVRTDAESAPPFVEIGPSQEKPVVFDPDAIEEALRDAARGQRHFPGYRVRDEQIRLARQFATNLSDLEVLLLEGGTGVGKSLAYLAAAIPFAIEQRKGGIQSPVVISTRTKLLQDQLMGKDIAAAARFLGYPEVRALSMKGRANYACARRLEETLATGQEPRIFAEDRFAFAALEACANTRPHGEIGMVPAALLRRFPPLRDLLRRSVARRAEQCTREQCATQRHCPLGRRRQALAGAHLVVVNHDLLLRWPADYPPFEHVIVDEVHDLVSVADEAFALELRPDEVLERFDEIFGRPSRGGRLTGGSLPDKGTGDRRDRVAWRRDIAQDLHALGRAVHEQASEFGEVQLPDPPGVAFEPAAKLANVLADRLDHAAEYAEAQAPESEDDEDPALTRAVGDLREGAEVLRLALAEPESSAVAAFERVDPPYDRYRLVVRRVSPADAFHEGLMEKLQSFAGVSASLFIEGDAFASLGELELEERAGERLRRDSVPSPFPYATHMRVVAMRGGGDELVAQTATVVEDLALRLGGRTLGLFTSLRRMDEVAIELSQRLRDEGIDVLTPRRATDDPNALVTRFNNGAAVLLGARKFWQGLDIPGDRLQAVVIEKLPFEVPTELQRRREARLKERGISPFQRSSLGKMLLNLKQMTGRLIRTEEDRGLVVIVEGRPDKRYFRRIAEALPEGIEPVVAQRVELPELMAEVGIGESLE